MLDSVRSAELAQWDAEFAALRADRVQRFADLTWPREERRRFAVLGRAIRARRRADYLDDRTDRLGQFAAVVDAGQWRRVWPALWSLAGVEAEYRRVMVWAAFHRPTAIVIDWLTYFRARCRRRLRIARIAWRRSGPHTENLTVRAREAGP